MERFCDKSVENKKESDGNKDQGDHRVSKRFVG